MHITFAAFVDILQRFHLTSCRTTWSPRLPCCCTHLDFMSLEIKTQMCWHSFEVTADLQNEMTAKFITLLNKMTAKFITLLYNQTVAKLFIIQYNQVCLYGQKCFLIKDTRLHLFYIFVSEIGAICFPPVLVSYSVSLPSVTSAFSYQSRCCGDAVLQLLMSSSADVNKYTDYTQWDVFFQLWTSYL